MSFNLVIEHLFVSTVIFDIINVIVSKFQSRNRASFRFNANEEVFDALAIKSFNLVIEHLFVSTLKGVGLTAKIMMQVSIS